MTELLPHTWPLSRAAEAVEALCTRCHLGAEGTRPPATAPQAPGEEALEKWLPAAAAWLGAEATAVPVTLGRLKEGLAASAPALLLVRVAGEARLLAVLGGASTRIAVLCPDLRVRRVAATVLVETMQEFAAGSNLENLDALLDQAGLTGRRRSRARHALLADQFGSLPFRHLWQLRPASSAGFWRSLRFAGLPGQAALMGASHASEYVLWILSWYLIGLAALQGRLDFAWLAAWGLALLTLIPLRLATTWLQGRLSIGAGGLLKRRLLDGALRLDQEEIRHQGAGQLLGRVLESDAVETLALGGGILGGLALIELVAAGIILSLGAGGPWQAFLLLAWTGVSLILGWRYLARYRGWSFDRLEMTHDLVEKMVGHRTRLAQGSLTGRHEAEDQQLARYMERSRVMDSGAAWLTAFMPRGWLVIAVASFAPAFANSHASTAGLAVALGGSLLAYRGLKRLAEGLWQIAGARVSWEMVAPLFRAASRPEPVCPPELLAADGKRAAGNNRSPLLEAQQVAFRHASRAETVLRGCSLRIMPGDRLLLEGPSGSGKSTLAALLGGIRTPSAGLLLAGGLDYASLGAAGWRSRVALAPQFHENHILTGTLAFNLLMGRRWPPTISDLAEAEALCRQLGLEELLERMPSGLLQIVGDTGWQLSHGERSRVYIARALLQGPCVVILDESFAALDPENLRRALECVEQRAAALLVIAHP